MSQQLILAKLYHMIYGVYFNKFREIHRLQLQSIVYLLENMGITVSGNCNMHNNSHDYNFKLIENNNLEMYTKYVFSLILGADIQGIDRMHYCQDNVKLKQLQFSEETMGKVNILKELVEEDVDLIVLAVYYYNKHILNKEYGGEMECYLMKIK